MGKRPDERMRERRVSLYRAGYTMQQIADLEGTTRAAISQTIRKALGGGRPCHDRTRGRPWADRGPFVTIYGTF